MTNTFKIGINPKILDKARNFFNSTTEDIVNELLQNSRRAGATKVKVTNCYDSNTIVIEDNGIGIFSNGVAINLGGSNWSSKTQEREDPAGCGLFSLANLDSVIESNGMKVRLDVKAFNGLREVEIEESDFFEGTRIKFKTINHKRQLEWILDRAFEFYPVQVEYNGVELNKPKDFLKDSVYIEEWEGLKIGVVKKYQRHFSEFELNFYGLVIKCPDSRRPNFISALGFTDLLVKVDIVDCPKLQLVLPSRKEVVSNDFLDLLFKQCKKVVYSYIKNYCCNGGSHTLSYKQWLEAKECFGVELPEARPVLFKWYPEINNYHSNHFDSKQDCLILLDNPVVYDLNQENYEQHTLYHALESTNKQITLVFPELIYEGYQWYDNLQRLKAVNTEFTCDGKKLSPEELLDDYSNRPDFIELKLLIKQDNVERILTLSTDLVLISENDCCDLDEALVILTKESKIKVEELVEILTLCFFSPCDDSDSDSYDTQAEYFNGEVWALARGLLFSQEEAVQARIKETVEKIISWLVPVGQKAVINAQIGFVTVELKSITEDALDVVKE
jgi:hypothetical protein